MIKKLLFLFFPVLLSAQISIETDYYGIDNHNRIIIINKNLDILNNSIQGIKEHLNIEGEIFNFNHPTSELQKGIQYSVTNNNLEYAVFFSDLPIVKMTTTGEIADSPKVLANFELVAPGYSKVSSLIGVEYRGASSQAYPKKSLEIEFWTNEAGSATHDISILDLFKEDGINLQAMYIENLRINSKTANELWQQIHPDVHYINDEEDAKSGILMKYTDLFLNGEYRGVYAFGEKVKRKFLKLKKFADNEIKGELYKGEHWGGATIFSELNPYDNSSDYWDGYEYKHPKELIDWSNAYNLVDYVVNSDTDTFLNTYHQKFDVQNILDYFIFMNAIRAIDNNGKNIYLAKYKKNSPYFYVPWDLDSTFGTYWEGSNQNIYDDLLFNGLYARLWEDVTFRNLLTDRWTELRTSVLSPQNLNGLLTSNFQHLKDNGIYTREKIVWSDYNFSESQLHYHTNWVTNRINYLDGAFAKLAVSENALPSTKINILPNPAKVNFYLDLSQEIKNASVKIIDFSGKVIKKFTPKNISSSTKFDVHGVSNGVYFVIIKSETEIKTAKLVVNK